MVTTIVSRGCWWHRGCIVMVDWLIGCSDCKVGCVGGPVVVTCGCGG